MHSSSLGGTSRSDQTSGATSDATSSCPYSEQSISQVRDSELAALDVQVRRPDQTRAEGTSESGEAANPFAPSGPSPYPQH